MVMRKLEAEDPKSWPVVDSRRKMLPSSLRRSSHKLGRSNSDELSQTKARQSIQGGVSKREFPVLVEDNESKDETIKALVEYCQTLQLRVKVF